MGRVADLGEDDMNLPDLDSRKWMILALVCEREATALLKSRDPRVKELAVELEEIAAAIRAQI